MECLAWTKWLENWVDRGNRLDMVVDLHNIESHGISHLFAYMYEPSKGGMRATMSALLNRSIVDHLPGYAVRAECDAYGTFRTRLGGWLRSFFGAHLMFYEANSQAPNRHLSLYQLKAMGVGMLQGVAAFLYSPQSAPLRQAIQHDRLLRYRILERYGWFERMFPQDMDAITREYKLYDTPYVERLFLKQRPMPSGLELLYEKLGRNGPPPVLEVHWPLP